MIDKLPKTGDWSALVDKINEIIDFVNALPLIGFDDDSEEARAYNEAADPHA